MKGLLLKDGYLVTKLCRSLLLIDVVFFAVALFSEYNAFFITYPCALAGTLPMTLIAFDEKEKWDQYAGTLPYTRGQLVSSKYLLVLIYVVIITIIGGCVQAYKMAQAGVFIWKEYLAITLILLTIGLLVPALLYPAVYRFGAEKGRMIYYFVFGAGWAAALSMGKFGAQFIGSLGALASTGAIAAGAIVLFGVSWLLSIRFYERREL